MIWKFLVLVCFSTLVSAEIKRCCETGGLRRYKNESISCVSAILPDSLNIDAVYLTVIPEVAKKHFASNEEGFVCREIVFDEESGLVMRTLINVSKSAQSNQIFEKNIPRYSIQRCCTKNDYMMEGDEGTSGECMKRPDGEHTQIMEDFSKYYVNEETFNESGCKIVSNWDSKDIHLARDDIVEHAKNNELAKSVWDLAQKIPFCVQNDVDPEIINMHWCETNTESMLKFESARKDFRHSIVVQKYEHDLEKAREREDQLKKDSSAKDEQIQKINATKLKVEEENKKLSTELIKVMERNCPKEQDLRNQIEKLNTEINKLKKKLTDLEVQKQNMTSTIENLEEKLQQKIKEIEEKDQKLEKATKNEEKLKEEKKQIEEKLNTEINKLKETLTDSEVQKQNMTSTIENLNEEVQRKIDEIEEKDQKLKKATKDEEKLREEKRLIEEKLNTEIQNLKKVLTDSKVQQQNMTSIIENLKEELQQKRNEIVEKDQKLKKATKDEEQLRKEKKQIEEKLNTEIKKLKNTLEVQVKESSEKLSETEKRYEEEVQKKQHLIDILSNENYKLKSDLQKEKEEREDDKQHMTKITDFQVCKIENKTKKEKNWKTTTKISTYPISVNSTCLSSNLTSIVFEAVTIKLKQNSTDLLANGTTLNCPKGIKIHNSVSISEPGLLLLEEQYFNSSSFCLFKESDHLDAIICDSGSAAVRFFIVTLSIPIIIALSNIINF